MDPLLIYGANGFTGELIARLGSQKNLKVILAGRNASSIPKLANELKLPYRIFDIDAPQFEGVSAILNCAGPFSRTAPQLMLAAIQAGVHYLDITGEIAVFEKAKALGDEAKKKGVILMPGVGFDVVPTDCIALSLKEAMPDATHLELAIYSQATLSRGTAKTMIENIPEGGKERINGVLKRFPLFYKTKRIQFVSQTVHCAAIPWGDLATAFYSTGIPNIIVYTAHPRGFVHLARLINPIRGLLKSRSIQNILKKIVDRSIHGPTPEQQKTARVEIWGKVSGPSGESEMRATVPEGYYFTSVLALECASRVTEKKISGYYTPAQAFGSHFLKEMPGVSS